MYVLKSLRVRSNMFFCQKLPPVLLWLNSRSVQMWIMVTTINCVMPFSTILFLILLLVWTRQKITANLRGKKKKKSRDILALLWNIPGFLAIKNPGIFLFRDFPGFKILGLKIPGFLYNQIPGILTPGIFWSRDNLGISRDRDIPSTSLLTRHLFLKNSFLDELFVSMPQWSICN